MRIAGLFVLVVVMGACSAEPVAPSFEGHTYGSGNSVSSPITAPTAPAADAVPGDSSGAIAGGHTYGSGN